MAYRGVILENRSIREMVSFLLKKDEAEEISES